MHNDSMSLRSNKIFLDALILISITVVFVSLTWGKWTHPLANFGREVYVPWRIANGELLYKDLAFIYGAFPPLFNALLFEIFGASIRTLVFFDLAVVMLDALLIYRFFYYMTGRTAAFFSALTFLVLYVFCFLYDGTNMYYLSPYSHSYFYALLFSLGVFNMLEQLGRKPQKRTAFLTGALLGLVFLSRFEIFLALCVSLLLGAVLLLWRFPKQRREILSGGAVVALGTLGVFVPFLIYVASYLPFAQALTAVMGYPQWQKVSELYLYKSLAGLTDVPQNMRLMAIVVFVYAAMYASLGLLGQAVVVWRTRRAYLQAGLMGVMCPAVFGFAAWWICHGWAHDAVRGAIVLVAALGGRCVALFFQDHARRDKMLVLIIFCLFSLFLLFKVPLSMKLYNYALVYGMPAGLLVTIFWVDTLPQMMQERYGTGKVSRILAVILLLCVCASVLHSSLFWLGRRNKQVGQGANVLWSLDRPLPYGSGTDVENFLKWARAELKPEDRFVTLPEGVMLNFLTNHKISGTHVSFNPAEMATFGEANMLRTLQNDPPEYVVYVYKNNAVYGDMVIGKNYAIHITRWVEENYQYQWSTGTDQRGSSCLKVYKRKRLLK